MRMMRTRLAGLVDGVSESLTVTRVAMATKGKRPPMMAGGSIHMAVISGKNGLCVVLKARATSLELGK